MRPAYITLLALALAPAALARCAKGAVIEWDDDDGSGGRRGGTIATTTGTTDTTSSTDTTDTTDTTSSTDTTDTTSSTGTTGCGGGLTLCGSQCVDTSTSTSHCGSCDHPCQPAQSCTNSTCTGGTCDPLNPAAACGSGQHCLPGSCPGGTPTCSGPTGTWAQYGGCTDNSSCAAIYECVDASQCGDTSLLCMQWCTSDWDCPGAWDMCFPMGCVGNVEYGVCYDGGPDGCYP